KVTNAGNVALSSVSVTDDHSGVNPALLTGDTNSNGKLDLGETWYYTAAGTATTGTYTNTGTATGDFTDDAGHKGSDTATDNSGYFGADPEIAINKVTIDGSTTAAGVAAAFATGSDSHNILTGEGITWIYQVTNAGNVALSNVS